MTTQSKDGEIYFIGERDRLTGEKSPYIKIGLVKAGADEQRSSTSRLGEHQTANPRQLVLHHSVATRDVQAVETILHGQFATRCVLGEWFKLDDQGMAEAVAAAEHWAAVMAEMSELARTAEHLKHLESNGTVLEGTQQIRDWHSDFLAVKAQIKLCKELDTLINSLATEAAAEGRIVEDVATFTPRTGSETFDSEAFRAAYPSQWESLQVTRSWIEGRFNPASIRSLPPVEDVNPSLAAFAKEVQDVVQAVRDHIAEPIVLTDYGLRLKQFKAALEPERSALEVRLKAACGEADGIAGVCTWKRTVKTEVKLDRQRLKTEFADIAKPFYGQTEPTVAIRRPRRMAADA
jgi:hypothetical protein